MFFAVVILVVPSISDTACATPNKLFRGNIAGKEANNPLFVAIKGRNFSSC